MMEGWLMNADAATILTAGGWVAVLVVVRWFMRQMEEDRKRLDRMVEGFEKAVNSFQRFETAEDEIHERIIAHLTTLTSRLEALRSAIEDLRKRCHDRE